MEGQDKTFKITRLLKDITLLEKNLQLQFVDKDKSNNLQKEINHDKERFKPIAEA